MLWLVPGLDDKGLQGVVDLHWFEGLLLLQPIENISFFLFVVHLLKVRGRLVVVGVVLRSMVDIILHEMLIIEFLVLVDG